MKVARSNGYWLILFIMFVSFLSFSPLTANATPERGEGSIEDSDVTDEAMEQNKVNPDTNMTKRGPFKIFLDPGHGGSDPGAQSNGLNEKDVVLDIALKTKEVLDNDYAGVKTKLSRSTDTFVALKDRSKMANDWGADYFTSFHLNSFDGASSGFESYIYNGNVGSETATRQLHIHTYLGDRLEVNDRGRKKANFSVLRNSRMSALLLEFMFIDNPDENKLLQSKKYRDYLGKLTAEAIADTYDLTRK